MQKSKPIWDTCETSQVLLAGVIFHGVLQFLPHILIGLFHTNGL